MTTARNLRQNPTEAEKRLWSRLRRKQLGGYRFRRQSPIGGYVVDFVCPSRKIIIEVDGGQHSASRDADRTKWLEGEGYRVLRYWNHDVLENTDGVLNDILSNLRDG